MAPCNGAVPPDFMLVLILKENISRLSWMINTAAWANWEWLNNLIMHGYLKRRSAEEGGESSEEP